MTPTQIIALAKEMRKAQKNYFRSPPMTNEKAAYLARSKRLEDKFDRAIEEYEQKQRKIPFDSAE